MVRILDRLSGNNSASNSSSSVRKRDLAGDQTRARHPEKISSKSFNIMRKPEWLRVRSANSSEYFKTRSIVSEHKLHTVCEEAACPNIGECWSKRHATFLIMGDTCTRACGFCNIRTGIPLPLDADEPERTGLATKKLSLRHVVITSVDRDDLPDGGGAHIAATIRSVRHHCPETTIEVLTPDFFRKDGAASLVISAFPDVFNHNLETVPSLYVRVRPGSRYYNSLRLLESVKQENPDIFTKSGIMLGLGEKRDEILQVMDDLRCAEVDFLTIGQYLPPTRRHHPLARYVPPAEFSEYEEIAYSKGFLMVSSSPLTRSSYHADADFEKLSQRRKAQNKRKS